ncbi:putative LysR family transcriptional regulator [Xanthomonas fragariae]|uniref:Putative LysR family transcriptional regulator n=1 Tax=Xanthomonas fragariae TaxID=48664 RepID=A0A1Y6GWW9_9XANT|nr:putative LysR family transcriptional regulator [Xanthomonas fragariae]SMQ99498.1 hypothetical protein PD885_02256 [Xanthomonas fragariae]SMR03530.1 putative LysR family transcriptional regulator [Xanthomonas fragariae]
MANRTTALTARRARPVLGIGMYHAYIAVPPRCPHPPGDCSLRFVSHSKPS